MSLLRYCLAVLLLASATSLMADTAVWDAVREGRAMIILRHAYAPGIGDPEHFRLGDCSTQRNLNAQGRKESVRWGSYLREQRLGSAHGLYQPLVPRSRYRGRIQVGSGAAST